MEYFKLFILLVVIWFVDFLIFSYLLDFGAYYIKLIENKTVVKICLATYVSLILLSIWVFYIIFANIAAKKFLYKTYK